MTRDRFYVLPEDVDPRKVGRKRLWFIFDSEKPNVVVADHTTRRIARDMAQGANQVGNCPRCGRFARNCELSDDRYTYCGTTGKVNP